MACPRLDYSNHEFCFVILGIELKGMVEVAYRALVLFREKEAHAQLIEHSGRLRIDLRCAQEGLDRGNLIAGPLVYPSLFHQVVVAVRFQLDGLSNRFYGLLILSQKHVGPGSECAVFWRAIGWRVFETRQDARPIFLLDAARQLLKSIGCRKAKAREKQAYEN